MKIFVILILLFTFMCNSHATVLHRYYDKTNGEERGICYSGRNEIPAINNPDWNVEVIPESQKQYYINLQRQQLEAKQKAVKDELKAKRKIIKDKLKAGTPLSAEDVDILVGESD